MAESNFVEARLPTDYSYNSRRLNAFSTSVSVMASKHEQRKQNWSEGRARYDLTYSIKSADNLNFIRAWHLARKGQAESFRFKDFDNFTSTLNDKNGNKIRDKQPIGFGDGSTNVFQLVKYWEADTHEIVELNGTDSPNWVKTNFAQAFLFSSGDLTRIGDSTDNDGIWEINDATDVSGETKIEFNHGPDGGSTSATVTTGGADKGNIYTLYGKDIKKPVDGTVTVYINGSSTSNVDIDHTNGELNFIDYTTPNNGDLIEAKFDFDIPVRFEIDEIPASWDDFDLRTTDITLIEVVI